ncbi:tRNA guanosine(34) transglycosylase Tgt [Patescibacteria group bacterium]|nr:tRNA guanosine(34) transglycosylase Tgt [Patescibacteria group bacterium]
MSYKFTIKKKSSECFARTGLLSLPHGKIQTPVFMPCGTKATVKTLSPADLDTLGIEIALANTYHLHLRPGENLISKMGGLNQWMNYQKPLLTDSGGFQVFSLGKMNKINDEGVTFRSHLDGKLINLTPEKAITVQTKLGADIIMAFDECAPADCDYQYAVKAMKRTHAWLKKCVAQNKKLATSRKHEQYLFPIIQGTIHEDLRLESLEFCAKYANHGIAIGGLSVGESKKDMYHILDILAPNLPPKIPHYLMGVGTPEDIINGVERGIDMFDCVLPTRLARHGAFWNETGRHNIKVEKNKDSNTPLQKDCKCAACKNFTKSYLRHLFVEKEILALRLLTIHNLHFLLELTRNIRQSITEDTFKKFKKNFFTKYKIEKNH